MDLKTFISQALGQVIEGIKEAQTKDGSINAASPNLTGGNLISGDYGVFTRVDFDVAVSAESLDEGTGSLKVFGIGMEGGLSNKSTHANRITFSVPVRLPDGQKRDRTDRGSPFRRGTGTY